MRREHNHSRAYFCGSLVLPLFSILFMANLAIPTFGQDAGSGSGSMSENLKEAYNSYDELEFDTGIKKAKSMLTSSGITQADSIAVFEFLSVCTYAKGKDFHDKAFGYLNTISDMDPCVDPMPQDFWCKQLCDKWHGLLMAKDALICTDDQNSDLKTIAFLPFDNYSVGEYQEKLGMLSFAIAEFFAFDFATFSGLKVVERSKLDYLLREAELVKGGKIDQTSAIRVGRMLGAHMMVFGSITQLDKGSSRMVARVVNVETSEIITSVSEEGKPDFNKMEKNLVKKLAKVLDLEIGSEVKNLLDASGSGSAEAMESYSRGLQAMDKYDYKTAYKHFKKAYEIDNKFTQAKTKMETYKPLIG